MYEQERPFDYPGSSQGEVFSMTITDVEDIADWNNCHHCGEVAVMGQEPEMNGLTITQDVTCPACHRVWTEVYEAVHRVEEDNQ